MDRNLLFPQQRIPGVWNKGSTNSSRSLLQFMMQLPNVIASADTNELKNRIIVFKRQYRLVGCGYGQLRTWFNAKYWDLPSWDIMR